MAKTGLEESIAVSNERVPVPIHRFCRRHFAWMLMLVSYTSAPLQVLGSPAHVILASEALQLSGVQRKLFLRSCTRKAPKGFPRDHGNRRVVFLRRLHTGPVIGER